MTTHLACVGVLVLCVATPAGAADPSPAQRLWEQGQDALRDGRTDDAMGLYERSLALDPNLADNHLSLAAAYLDKGDDERAGEQLARYLEAPAASLHRPRTTTPNCCSVSTRSTPPVSSTSASTPTRRIRWSWRAQELVHCHSRLMELAEREDDDYATHLHRGIGLYLLARQQESLSDDEEGYSPESLLCKAAGELILAGRERPDEARPCWYLFEVWSQLAQRQPAARWLRTAKAAAAFSYLTPAERRDLETAIRGLDAEARTGNSANGDRAGGVVSLGPPRSGRSR